LIDILSYEVIHVDLKNIRIEESQFHNKNFIRLQDNSTTRLPNLKITNLKLNQITTKFITTIKLNSLHYEFINLVYVNIIEFYDLQVLNSYLHDGILSLQYGYKTSLKSITFQNNI